MMASGMGAWSTKSLGLDIIGFVWGSGGAAEERHDGRPPDRVPNRHGVYRFGKRHCRSDNRILRKENCPDGEYPQAGLVESPLGDFYGTTYYGGASRGDGTVFKITPSGELTTLCSFCLEPNCTDGANPGGVLI